MSGSCSTVSSIVNSGAISISPPMLATTDDRQREADRLAFELVVGAEHRRYSAGSRP
jgi:hypothetical protein